MVVLAAIGAGITMLNGVFRFESLRVATGEVGGLRIVQPDPQQPRPCTLQASRSQVMHSAFGGTQGVA